MSGPVAVVVANWNGGPLLRVALASLLRFDAGAPLEVIVVDGGSTDASRATAEGAAARGLVRLVQRGGDGPRGAADHGAALDAGLAAATAPLVFTLDSDAWARRDGWLRPFLDAVEGGASHAGAAKAPGGLVQRAWARVTGRAPPPDFVRTCHALYRADLLRAHGLSFRPDVAPGPDGAPRPRTVGQALHEGLVARGLRPAFLDHALVEARVGHLRHGTIVLNAARFPGLRARARRRGERALRRFLASAEVAALLAGSPVP